MTPGNKVRSSEQLHSFPRFPGFGKNDPTPPRMEQLSLAGASWEKLEGRKEERGMGWIQREHSRSKHWEDSPGSLGRWESCCWNCWSWPRIKGASCRNPSGMGASSLSLAHSRGWEWRGFLWSTEDSPGAAPLLPETSGTANPGRVVALSRFFGHKFPPSPLRIPLCCSVP